MIATITLNPSLDEHIAVHGLVMEETNRWSRLHRYAGGKGIDVSRAIHEMGGVSVAYGFSGGANGRDGCAIDGTSCVVEISGIRKNRSSVAFTIESVGDLTFDGETSITVRKP